MKQAMKVVGAALSALLFAGCSGNSSSTSDGSSAGSSANVAFSETTDPVQNSRIISGTTFTNNPENTIRGMLKLSCSLPEKTLNLEVGSYAAVAGADGMRPGAEINFASFEQRWGKVTSEELQYVLLDFTTYDLVNVPNIQLTRVFRGKIAQQQRLLNTVAKYDTALTTLDRLLQKLRAKDSLYLAIDALPDVQARPLRDAIDRAINRGFVPVRDAESTLPPDIRTPALDAMLSQAINLAVDLREIIMDLQSSDAMDGYNVRPEFAQDISDQTRNRRASIQEELDRHRATWGTVTTDTDPNSLMQSLGADWAFSFAASGGRISMTMDVASMNRVVSACLQ